MHTFYLFNGIITYGDIGRKQEKIVIYEPEAKESSDIVTEHAV